MSVGVCEACRSTLQFIADRGPFTLLIRRLQTTELEFGSSCISFYSLNRESTLGIPHRFRSLNADLIVRQACLGSN